MQAYFSAFESAWHFDFFVASELPVAVRATVNRLERECFLSSDKVSGLLTGGLSGQRHSGRLVASLHCLL